MLQQKPERTNSKQNLKEEHQAFGKNKGLDKNVLDILLKPEKEHQQIQEPLLIKKHPKKKSRGLHL